MTDLTVDQVAAALQISPRSVQELCRTGRIGAYRIGKLWRIPSAALKSFRRSALRTQGASR